MVVFGRFDVTDKGAVGDGVTDDSPAIQSAIDDAAAVGGTVDLPARTYRLASGLIVPLNVAIEGQNRDPGAWASKGSWLRADSGVNALTIDSPAHTFPSNISFRNFSIQGGQRQLSSPRLSTFVTLENVHFNTAGEHAIYGDGAIEEWTLRDVSIANPGVDGFHFSNIPDGSNDYIDKSTFYSVYITGAGRDGWHLECATSTTVAWHSPTFNMCGRHGFYAAAGFAGWVMTNPNTEDNGHAGRSALTTGSMAAGSTTLTVANGANFANGDPITVQGAAGWKDLHSTVVSGGGTTVLILADPAGGTVSNVEVTNRDTDDIYVSGGSDFTVLGGIIGNGSYCRYAINGESLNALNVFGAIASRPVYNLDQSTILGGDVKVRQVPNIGQAIGKSTILTKGDIPWAMVPSGAGTDTVLYLRDSNENGTGTFGRVVVRTRQQVEALEVRGSDWGVVQKYPGGYLQVAGKFYLPLLGGGTQTGMAQYVVLSGAPDDSLGVDGDICWRKDGTIGSTLYRRVSGHWTPIL